MVPHKGSIVGRLRPGIGTFGAKFELHADGAAGDRCLGGLPNARSGLGANIEIAGKCAGYCCLGVAKAFSKLVEFEAIISERAIPKST